MKKQIVSRLSLATVGLSLLLLPGCGHEHDDVCCSSDLKNESVVSPMHHDGELAAGDTWLVRIGGRNVLGKKEFDDMLSAMIAQQFRGALTLDALPGQIKLQYLNQLAKTKALEQYAMSMGIEKRKEFAEQYEKACNLIRQQLLVQFLRKDIYDKQSTNDSDAKAYYNEHRKDYVKEAGGIDVHAVKFTGDDALSKAKEFDSSVKGKTVAEFDELGRTAPGGLFVEYGRLEADSPRFPESMRATLGALRSFPHTGMVHDGDTYFVFCASDKKDPVYMNFDEVKQHVEEMQKQTQWQKEMTKLEDKLMKDLNVQVNDEPFKQPEMQQMAVAEQPKSNEPQVA